MRMMHGLFKIHDTQGVPLSISLLLLAERGETGNLAEFFFDAMIALWTPETALNTIEAACRDNDLPFDRDEFWLRAAACWTRLRTWEACAKACGGAARL